MSLAAIVDALAEAGCTAQQIAAAVRAHEQAAAPRSRSAAAERMARYRAARKANGMSTSFDGAAFTQTLAQRDGDGCVYCGNAAEPATVDHITPVCQGGTDDLDNLAIACRACNGRKSGRTPQQAGMEIKSPSALAAHVRYCSGERFGRTVTQKEISPTPPKEKTTSLTNVREKSTRVRASEADFALVRNAYPKRIGGDPREPARKALDKALAGGASVDEIVDGARLFARFRAADDPKFTPMLATWLNRRGWADDYSEPPPRAGPLPRQSILAQIATGEIWHERDFNDIDCDSAGRAEPRGFGSGRADEELSGAPGGPGKVLDFRRTGSGWG